MKSKRRNPIYVSPDGGETVYEQLPNGEKLMVEESQLAKDRRDGIQEYDMVGEDAIALRRQFPTLKKAWERYQTIWNLVVKHD